MVACRPTVHQVRWRLSAAARRALTCLSWPTRPVDGVIRLLPGSDECRGLPWRTTSASAAGKRPGVLLPAGSRVPGPPRWPGRSLLA